MERRNDPTPYVPGDEFSRGIRRLLLAVRAGAEGVRDWSSVLDRQVFCPCLHASDSEIPSEVFRVACLHSGEEDVINVFTEATAFLEWSGGKYDFIPVSFADLLLTVSKRHWIVLDPNTDGEEELDPQAVGDLRRVVLARLAALSEEAGMDLSAFDGTADDSSAPEELADSALSECFGPGEPSLFDHDGARRRLVQILSEFDEFAEAFFCGFNEAIPGILEARSGRFPLRELCSADAILGILFEDGISLDRRFQLGEAVARVSEEFYGEPGAIEVYDDLVVKSSRSWELFSYLTPFYYREHTGYDEEESSPHRKLTVARQREVTYSASSQSQSVRMFPEPFRRRAG